MLFITDRSATNVDTLNRLNRLGWDRMTTYERALWTGNPLTAQEADYPNPVNLLPHTNNPFTTSSTETIVVGTSEYLAGKTVTLSAGATSGMRLQWVNDGATSTIGTLSEGGSMTVPTGTGLILVVELSAGRHEDVMLEFGSTRHDYVSYYDILPTEATKGAYNYSDLNRVARSVDRILMMLSDWAVPIKTDWSKWDIPTEDDMSTFLYSIEVVRDLHPNKDALPEVPKSMSGFTYKEANDIEKILQAVYEYALSVNEGV